MRWRKKVTMIQMPKQEIPMEMSRNGNQLYLSVWCGRALWWLSQGLLCGPIILTMVVATTSTRSLVYSALNYFSLVCSIMRTELKQNSSPPSWQDGRAGNNNLQKLSLAQFSALATSVLQLFNCISCSPKGLGLTKSRTTPTTDCGSQAWLSPSAWLCLGLSSCSGQPQTTMTNINARKHKNNRRRGSRFFKTLSLLHLLRSTHQQLPLTLPPALSMIVPLLPIIVAMIVPLLLMIVIKIVPLLTLPAQNLFSPVHSREGTSPQYQ